MRQGYRDMGRWSRSTAGDEPRSVPVVARRRGSLLLVAFLAAIIAGGGGGVSAPWLPSPSKETPAITVAQARLASGFVTWRTHRME